MQAIERIDYSGTAQDVETRSALNRIGDWFKRPWFAYSMLGLLQLKVLWAMWTIKDLDLGDSIEYWAQTCITFDRSRIDIVWSPLYSALGAGLLHIYNNPYFYCIATRICLVSALSFITLAIMRRMLPAGLAWFVAAWWTCLPVNFDTLYSVHLFGSIPIVASWLILQGEQNNRWRRGIALALMIVSSVLVRNEGVVYTLLFGGALVMAELLQYLHRDRNWSLWAMLKPYVIPLTLAGALSVGFFLRSWDKGETLKHQMRAKEAIAVGQPFCFGYQQRFPNAWKGDVWSQYHELMKQQFGVEDPTLSEALARNPKAYFDHCLWNVSLIPTGMQLLLFNEISGGPTPDYITFPTNFALVMPLSILVLALLGFAGVQCWKKRDETKAWVKSNRWPLIAFVCYLPLAAIVMITHRPRAAYVFPLGIALMGMVGLSVWNLFRSKRLATVAGALCPVVMAALIVFIPSYYPAHGREVDRPCLQYYEFLKPFVLVMGEQEGKIVVPLFAEGLSHYLYGGSSDKANRRFFEIRKIKPLMAPHADVLQVLRDNDVSHILVDSPPLCTPLICPPEINEALSHSKEWYLVSLMKMPGRNLAFYTRSHLYRGERPHLPGVTTLETHGTAASSH